MSRAKWLRAHADRVLETERLELGEFADALVSTGAVNNLRAAADEIDSLSSKLHQCRQDTIRECWDAINKHIPHGQLQGNGCDDTAQRNGMILATNVLNDLMESPK